MDYCANRIHIQGGKEEDDPWSLTYEVDTVQLDGTIQTDDIPRNGRHQIASTKPPPLNFQLHGDRSRRDGSGIGEREEDAGHAGSI